VILFACGTWWQNRSYRVSTFCPTGTPDLLAPSATSSAPSSVPSGGYGVKALLGSKATSSKNVPAKSRPGIKKFSPVASGSGSSTIERIKARVEKEQVTSIEKDKKKCAQLLIPSNASLTAYRELKKKKRKRENDDSDAEEQRGASAWR
jgi:transcriptional adapter 3